MRLFYISDLHLKNESDPSADRFLRFLDELPRAGDELILGGDIFDLFIGNKPVFCEKFKGILSKLSQLSESGIGVHYLEGNHDFHMAHVFPKTINVYENEFFLSFAGKRVLVAHGDLIDHEDHGYLLLRSVTRNGMVRALIEKIPGEWIESIGAWSSKQSRKYNNPVRAGNVKKARTMNLFREHAKSQVLSGSCDLVLIGHSHYEQNCFFESDANGRGQYLNLGVSSAKMPYGELVAGSETMVLKMFE